MKILYKKICWTVFALLLAVCCLFQSVHTTTARADGTETVYSNVLDDLKRDPTFDFEKYPEIADDYSLQVFQIAESKDKELFIYVYQPSNNSKNLVASGINLSTSVQGDNIDFDKNFLDYSLVLLSSEGVFDKYLVKDFEVKSDVLRFYEIAAVYRPFDSSIDEPPVDDNTIEGIACDVGQLWTATTYNGSVIYAMDLQDTIKVDSKHVGFIRYMDLKLFTSHNYTDSHYVAFSTDKPIDTLLQADITYTVNVFYSETNSLFVYNDYKSELESKVNKTLDRDTVFSKDNWFGDDYEYNRIQSIDEFLDKETEEFTQETKAALSDKQWVLRFYESPYSHRVEFTTSSDSYIQNSKTTVFYHEVSYVSILRLKYEYQGDIYDLGVVDNVSSGDANPDNKDWDKSDNDDDWLLTLLAYLILGVALVFVCTIFPPVVKVLEIVFKALWWVVCLPIKLLRLLFKGAGKLKKK